MKNHELIGYVQNVHFETRKEVERLMKKVMVERDFDALSFDNTSKVLNKLWDALAVIEQKLNEGED